MASRNVDGRLNEGWHYPAEQHDVDDKHQDQDEDDGRDVDAAEIRQDAADWSQRRLGYAIEHLGERIDETIGRIDHVKGNQPTQDGAGNDHPYIELDDINDEFDQRHHQETSWTGRDM